MIDALNLALQGLFPLSAIAAAVQGLIDAASNINPPSLEFRPGVVGSGPGTQISLSDYLKQLRRGAALPVVDPALAQKHARQRRMAALRKQEDEILLLCQAE